MAGITDYDSLVASIVRKLANSDLTSTADEFIQLAEAMFNRRLHNLEMEDTATTATVLGDPTLAWPDDFRAVKSLYIDTDPRTLLTYMTPDQLRTYWSFQDTGKPQNYSIINDQIELGPTPDGVYTVNLTYIRTLVPLSTDNPSNWLLDKYPDAYLYAALGHAELDGWNDERAAKTFYPLAEQIIDEINKEGLRRRFSPGLRMRPSVIEII